MAISIQSGPGYAGSIYHSDVTGGQWFAGESAIVGETGATWTMTVEREGEPITYRVGGVPSNTIEMWVPTDLASLAVWFDPIDTRTISASGSQLVSIANKAPPGGSGTSRDANYRTSLTTMNDRQAIAFANSNTQEIVLPQAILSGQQASAAFVIGARGAKTAQTLLGGGNNSLLPIAQPNNTNTEAYRNLSPVPTVFRDGAQIATSTRGAAFNAFTSASPAIVIANAFTTTAIFERIGFGPFNFSFNGTLGESVIVFAALTPENRQLLEGYLAHRWGTAGLLPADHPCKTAAPRIAHAEPPAGPNAYVLYADPRDLAVAGRASRLARGAVLAAAPGRTSSAGRTSDLKRNAPILVQPRSVTVAGRDAVLRAGRRIDAAPASAADAGRNATVFVGRRIGAEHRSASLTGGAVDLRLNRRIGVEPGAETIVARDVALRADRRAKVAPSRVAAAGQRVAMNTARSFTLIAVPAAVELAPREAAMGASNDNAGDPIVRGGPMLRVGKLMGR